MSDFRDMCIRASNKGKHICVNRLQSGSLELYISRPFLEDKVTPLTGKSKQCKFAGLREVLLQFLFFFLVLASVYLTCTSCPYKANIFPISKHKHVNNLRLGSCSYLGQLSGDGKTGKILRCVNTKYLSSTCCQSRCIFHLRGLKDIEDPVSKAVVTCLPHSQILHQ
jgi:hypothetical protein